MHAEIHRTALKTQGDKSTDSISIRDYLILRKKNSAFTPTLISFTCCSTASQSTLSMTKVMNCQLWTGYRFYRNETAAINLCAAWLWHCCADVHWHMTLRHEIKKKTWAAQMIPMSFHSRISFVITRSKHARCWYHYVRLPSAKLIQLVGLYACRSSRIRE